jgi:hypothetical protein
MLVMAEPTPKMLHAETAMKFVENEVAPMVASLASQGALDAHESIAICEGIAVLRDYVDFMRRNADQLRRLIR